MHADVRGELQSRSARIGLDRRGGSEGQSSRALGTLFGSNRHYPGNVHSKTSQNAHVGILTRADLRFRGLDRMHGHLDLNGTAVKALLSLNRSPSS